MPANSYETLKPLLGPDRRAMILIRPDPDSLAGAWALAHLFKKNRSKADIAIYEQIKRIENRHMVKLLRIPLVSFKDIKVESYDRKCMVDAQPNQFPELSIPQWDIVIDHHPPASGYSCGFSDIKPDIGAASSIVTEYLKAAEARINERLATALCYGIITDTDGFQRDMTGEDARAFSFLFPSVNYRLLQMIEQTEINLRQLDYFDLALHRIKVKTRRAVIHIGPADSADIAVILADFFIRVSGIMFVAVSVIANEKLIIIFRSRSMRKDAGKIAAAHFSDLGSAGGHHGAARAEIPLEHLPAEVKLYDPDSVEKFIGKRLSRPGRSASADGNNK
jgi:nanoRNase/pAp phosphatase (c-di-AMP/oligoRNAs hydrolase)